MYFEKGWIPLQAWDFGMFPLDSPTVLIRIMTTCSSDGTFHGGLLRLALANWFDIGVKALEYVGIYDDPGLYPPEKDGLIGFLKQLGLTSLTRDDYGLSLPWWR